MEHEVIGTSRSLGRLRLFVGGLFVLAVLLHDLAMAADAHGAGAPLLGPQQSDGLHALPVPSTSTNALHVLRSWDHPDGRCGPGSCSSLNDCGAVRVGTRALDGGRGPVPVIATDKATAPPLYAQPFMLFPPQIADPPALPAEVRRALLQVFLI